MPETFVKVDVAVRSSNPIGVIGASYVVHATERSLQFALESGACWAVHDDRFLATLERDPETPLNTVVEIEKSGRGLFRAMAKRRVTDDAKTQRLIYGWIVSDFRDRPASCAMLLPRGGVER